jgi:phosphodiesterase/alkaline phosphatase D-like protein
VLYESLSDTKEVHVSLWTKQDQQQLVHQQQVTMRNRPYRIQFNNLAEDTNYVAIFEEVNNRYNTANVTFKTFSNSPKSTKIIAVSCNRYIDDKDVTMWKQVENNEQDRQGMIHLGDQIYADRVAKAYEHSLKQGNGLSFETLVEQFRQIYRYTYSQPDIQAVMRNGAHWTIPDDHDIINGLGRHIFETNNVTNHLKIVLEAGRQAFYEYQFQLLEDVYTTDHIEKNEWTEKVKKDEIFYLKRISDICFIFLDFRFQNTFQFNGTSQLIGYRQFNKIHEYLHSCRDARGVVVITSVPLLVIGNFIAEMTYKISGDKYTNHADYLPDTTELLDTLGKYQIDNPTMFVKLVGGDVHHFFMSKICNGSNENEANVCLDQLVTSGMTRKSTISKAIPLVIGHGINRYLTKPSAGTWRLVRYDNNATHFNQYLGRNYAVMQIDPNSDKYFMWKGVHNQRSARENIIEYLYDRFLVSTLVSVAIFTLITVCLMPIAFSRFRRFNIVRRE